MCYYWRMGKKINDGLTGWQRYRLKDVEAFRKRRREWAKTPSQKIYRRKYMRMWTEKNREKYNKWAREYHRKNKWKYDTPEFKRKLRSYHLKRTFGITIEEYENLLKKQENVCAICKNNMIFKRKLDVDHDHKTGKIRGLLCSNCNGSLGWYEKNKKMIENYLGIIY